MGVRPQVLSTIPKNYEKDIPVTASMVAEFNIDLDNRYINEFAYLLDGKGNRIEGRVNYRKKKITFTPLQPLKSGTMYQFFLIGDSNVEDDQKEGIRSILGDPMAGNVSFTFYTEVGEMVIPPLLLKPTNRTVVRQTPIFEWGAVTNAAYYEIRVSRSNLMTDLIFPLQDDYKIYDTKAEINILWEEGIYYWAMRAVRSDGKSSDWTEPSQFHYTTLIEGSISEEDAPPVEIIYDRIDNEIELIEVFPEEGIADVPTNTKSIFFRFIGELDPNLLTSDSIEVFGKHVSGDMTEPSHGKVAGNVHFVTAADGTTYLVFTPDPLGEI